MTNEFAIKVLTELRGYGDKFANIGFDRKEALDMAIKALEKQQRDCKTCKHSNDGNCAYTEECHECMWENQYESQRWIPVSERLPEKSGKYLVTVKNGNVYAGTYDAFSGRFQCGATAWQSLPTPYKAESEE